MEYRADFEKVRYRFSVPTIAESAVGRLHFLGSIEVGNERRSSAHMKQQLGHQRVQGSGLFFPTTEYVLRQTGSASALIVVVDVTIGHTVNLAA